MDLENLKLFLHLTESLHFGKTSRECHVSPPTLSRVIQRLESECGQTLFERDRRTVSLTPAGREFRNFAAETVRRWNQIHQSFRQDEAVLRGELNLFCSLTASYCLLPRLLERFHQRHPEVRIKIITGDANSAIDRVMQGEAELCISPLPSRVPASLSAHLIAKTPLQLIIPQKDGPVREQMMRGRIPWGEVPIVLQDSGIIRVELLQWLARKGVEPRVYSQVAGHEAILVLVSLGVGIGVVPKLVLDHSLIDAQVEVVQARPVFSEFDVALCTLTRQLNNPVVRAFWESREQGDGQGGEG